MCRYFCFYCSQPGLFNPEPETSRKSDAGAFQTGKRYKAAACKFATFNQPDKFGYKRGLIYFSAAARQGLPL